MNGRYGREDEISGNLFFRYDTVVRPRGRLDGNLSEMGNVITSDYVS